MALFDAKTLYIEDCTVVWDGITTPEMSDGNNKLRYSLKVVVHPNNPDIALLHKLANDCLLASEFKGVLPNGGLMPVGIAGQAEFGGMFPGYAVVNASTYLQPQVFDENGKELQPMQYGPMLYSGQKVRLLVTCFAYNNKSKGVKASLEGFQIIASAQAPRLQIGGGGGAAAKAFGTGAPAAAPGGYGQAPAAPAAPKLVPVSPQAQGAPDPAQWAGWTQEMLIAQGHFALQTATPAAPAAPVAPPAPAGYGQAPAAPAAPKLVPVSPQAQGAPDPAQWAGWTQEMLIAQGHFALQVATPAPAGYGQPPAAQATPPAPGGYPAQAHNFLPQ